ncbi:MAG: hypothetical protein JSU77_12630 [Fidelibacterota bacterium]|nr:MAG: hypothetical protein JSU77_12630 [Candidatus Neomarinimicrobiota bacterium]
MANRAGGRSGTKAKSTSSRAKGRSSKSASKAEEKLQPQNNQEVIRQKLEELTAPILEKYGIPAFDEIMNRLETTVKEFTEEVNTLFSEMVIRSREDHERMKSLLTDDEGDEGGHDEKTENNVEMSEFEKRLELMEKENTSKSKAKGGKK